MIRCLYLLVVIFGAQCALAPFITPCKLGDTACYVKSAQAVVPIFAPGLPELGVKSLDPMRLDLIEGNQAGLQLKFTDTVVTGMKGCHVDGIKHDLGKAKQSITLRCDVELNGQYKLGGRLLVLPIQGEGKYKIVIRDIIIKAIAEIVVVNGEDGKPHWHIKDWRHIYQVQTLTRFHFENLFNGNKALADPVENFANQNWRDVMKEIAPPIVHAIVSRVVEGIETFYKAVPSEELYLK